MELIIITAIITAIVAILFGLLMFIVGNFIGTRGTKDDIEHIVRERIKINKPLRENIREELFCLLHEIEKY